MPTTEQTPVRPKRAGRPPTPGVRNALLDAAERLFAERNIPEVSMREIARAAGQGNNNAVQYHIGDRGELLRAITDRRAALLDERRAQLLAELDRRDSAPTLEDLIWVLVLPLLELIGHEEYRWYLRFLANAMDHNGATNRTWEPAGGVTPALRELGPRVRTLLATIPAPHYNRRMLWTVSFIARGLAQYELALAAGVAAIRDGQQVASDLVIASAALLSAPVQPGEGNSDYADPRVKPSGARPDAR